MYRIIFYIIALIISLLLPDSRYENSRYSSYYGRRRYNRYYNFFEDDFDGGLTAATGENDTVSSWIRAKLRRRRALKSCKKYLSKDKYILTLKNASVIFIYDTKNKIFTCLDNRIKERTATIIWAEQSMSMLSGPDNLFEKTFDNICISFNDKANFSGIIENLKEQFTIHETNPYKKTPKARQLEDEKPIKLDKYIEKLDINLAEEAELAKLPGISIILAKRIIKERDVNGGFKTLDEFYSKMKIKPHFQKQLNDMICINEQHRSSQNNSDSERIIDF